MNIMATLAKMMGPGSEAGTLQDRLTQGVLEKLGASEGGGLACLVERFHAKGLGDIVQSWIGNGPNQAITPEQIKTALGSEWVQHLAAHLGLPPDAVAAHLSDALPKIVDALTPEGKLPDDAATA